MSEPTENTTLKEQALSILAGDPLTDEQLLALLVTTAFIFILLLLLAIFSGKSDPSDADKTATNGDISTHLIAHHRTKEES